MLAPQLLTRQAQPNLRPPARSPESSHKLDMTRRERIYFLKDDVVGLECARLREQSRAAGRGATLEVTVKPEVADSIG